MWPACLSDLVPVFLAEAEAGLFELSPPLTLALVCQSDSDSGFFCCCFGINLLHEGISITNWCG